IEARVKALADFMRAQLQELPGVQVLDRGEQLCGIVTAHSMAWQPKTLLGKLSAQGINGRISPLLVAQIDFPRKGVEWALRLSPHYYNTEAEILRAMEVLRSITD
ncbi:MAG: hypothetical protein LH618_18740, partial [Saprospiraceae bacterium]|nr:hypothetical protein [Saprospiraceae bacterium]